MEAPGSANDTGRRGGLKLNNSSVLNISAAIRRHITAQQQQPAAPSDTESESDVSSSSSYRRNVGAARIAMAAAKANASQSINCQKLLSFPRR